MKKGFVVFSILGSMLLYSCASTKSGCPSDGRNVGAELLMGGNPSKAKSARNAPRYKMDKFGH